MAGLQKDEDWNPEDRVRYNTHLRELVESVSVALARSVASALLWLCTDPIYSSFITGARKKRRRVWFTHWRKWRKGLHGADV